MSAETILYTSCTPHRPRTRYHIVFEDFEEIGVDIYNAHALRGFEVSTNQRIRQLRERYGIPETHLPHEDDLWVPMPYRALEALTLKSVSKSVCQRVLAEEAVEDMPPSLIELGFIRRRFIARRTNESRKRPLSTIYADGDGEFMLVDEGGNFVDEDGLEQSAMMYGFGLIERQYLYCIEAINAAIAALDGLEPPQPMPRCEEPMIRRCVPPRRQKESVAAQKTAQETTSYDVHHDAKFRRSAARRGTNPYNALSVNPHNSTDYGEVSREFDENRAGSKKPGKSPVKPVQPCRNTIDASALRVAPWAPETLMALSAAVLSIPARPTDGDEEALQRWLTDWYEPAVRLIAATSDLSPQLAWEHIDLTTRYMATPGSPSWWQRPASEGGRKTKAPVTLRNVADRLLIEYADFDRHRNQWWPSETTPYDGPALEYEAGYGGEELPALVIEAEATTLPDGHIEAITEVEEEQGQAPDRDEKPREEPTTDEVGAVPAPVVVEEATRLPGMNRVTAEHLGRRIRERCPAMTLDVQPATDDGERVYVGIEYGPGQWWYFSGISEWLRPDPETVRLIEEAIAFNMGMRVEVAASLIDRIKERYPGLIVKWCYLREDHERIMVSIEYAQETYWDLYDPREWARRTKEQQQRIEEALLYAAALESGGDDPPQDVAEEETNDDQRSQDRATDPRGGLSGAMLSQASG
jgi:hypothetical protein